MKNSINSINCIYSLSSGRKVYLLRGDKLISKQAKNKKDKPAKEARGKIRNNHPRVVRDSFTMPVSDYERLKSLKKLCLSHGVHIKKGELLRAGIMTLVAMESTELLSLLEKVERVKTGRPANDNSKN